MPAVKAPDNVLRVCEVAVATDASKVVELLEKKQGENGGNFKLCALRVTRAGRESTGEANRELTGHKNAKGTGVRFAPTFLVMFTFVNRHAGGNLTLGACGPFVARRCEAT